MSEGQPSFSALTAAAARAAHLIVDRQPVIFADTLAAPLLGERADELLAYHTRHGTHPVLSGARTQVACRSRYVENALARVAGRGITQYVILGAGLDSSAYRDHAGVRVFEVDHPATQDWKLRALAAARIGVPESVAFVPVDLAAGSPGGQLAAAGFDTAAPALVSWLGGMMYLPENAVAETLEEFGGLPAGTEVIADYMLSEELQDEAGTGYATQVAEAAAGWGEPWRSYFTPGDITALARAAGFGDVRNVRQRDTIPAGLWKRSDALSPSDLAMLFHGTVGP